ncbi:inositol monophosphatase family protein [Bacillus kexueae]|uniref:inositol monophosphatase family protein n=1 Tax=Aeribacillus kexueae TaxID=2078952 RepID=UPI001FAF7F8B|nr:inositol monophosphatase family protein [Bacillus kexueae]
MNNWKEIDQHAKEWVYEAGKMIRSSFEKTLSIHTKSNPNDLVTDIDQAVEAYLCEKIRTHFPDHKILGEEGAGHELTTLDGIVWIIDPIDGTMNFVHQQRNFCISVGIYEDGKGIIGLIYDVVHDELYHAVKGQGAYMNETPLPKLSRDTILEESILAINATWVIENKRIDPTILAPVVKKARGTRSFGSAALEFAYVATGRLDGYITMRLSPWDIAAGVVIVEEVGGIATTLEGNEIDFLKKSSIFVANPNVHQQVMEKYLKDHFTK